MKVAGSNPVQTAKLQLKLQRTPDFQGFFLCNKLMLCTLIADQVIQSLRISMYRGYTDENLSQRLEQHGPENWNAFLFYSYQGF